MRNKISSKHSAAKKHRSEILGKYFNCFVNWMQNNGYSKHTIRNNLCEVTHFEEYLHRKKIHSIHQLEGIKGKKILESYICYCKQRGRAHRSRGLKSYLQSLKEVNVISNLATRDSLLPLTKQFLASLRRQNNLSEGTIRRHQEWIENFLRFYGHNKKISSIKIIDIDKFIEHETVRLNHAPHHSFCSAFRSFIGFLYNSKRIYNDFSYLIAIPRSYKLQYLPTVLGWSDIQKLLKSVNRLTRQGLQYYAILLMLTTYGLRAGEVAQLKLDDINWRNETIHITQRKNRKDLWLPLIPEVGNIILKYLKHARPISKYREVFIHIRAPQIPLKTSNIIYIVNRHIQLAELQPPRRGAHILRHSFATHLIRQGVPFKQISDMLGHRAIESTHIYTKTAIERLREVALEIPEVK